MRKLDRDERLQLLKFVCSFAWTDLRVTQEERDVIQRLVERYEFDAGERRQIAEWLKVPPPPEEVDPLDIPREHRQRFYDAAREVVAADGKVVPGENDSLALFRELLHE